MSFLTSRDFANLDFYNIYLGLTKQNMTLTSRDFQSLDLYNLYLGAISTPPTRENPYLEAITPSVYSIPPVGSVFLDTSVKIDTTIKGYNIKLNTANGYMSLLDNLDLGTYLVNVNLEIQKTTGTDASTTIRLMKQTFDGINYNYENLGEAYQTFSTNGHVHTISVNFLCQFLGDDAIVEQIYIQLEGTNNKMELRPVGDAPALRVTLSKVSNDV